MIVMSGGVALTGIKETALDEGPAKGPIFYQALLAEPRLRNFRDCSGTVKGDDEGK